MPEPSDPTSAPKRMFPVGAEITDSGCSVRVWAPDRHAVTVVTGNRAFELEGEPDGYFTAIVPLQPGDHYWLRLDHEPDLFADPASRYQPEGLHGPSEIVDPSRFTWSDAGWRGLSADGQVIYEMHIGTFTPAGTWRAAIEQLDKLADLGVTAVEVLPVAEFEAEFGWGYDSVLHYAPTRLYGHPDDLRSFVDAAHSRGIGVILDVVYNHFGVGAKFDAFTSHYHRSGRDTEWGRALDFDAAGVREYFVSNAEYWIKEFHLDGLRIDAAHAMEDTSPEHIIAEIARRTRAAAGDRGVLLIAEDEPQHATLVRPPAHGGRGVDAVWNEDFHHSAMVAATGRQEAYLHDHQGTPDEFVAGAKFGWLYQGQRYDWQDKGRGTDALDLRACSFVNYLQNHDQVANSVNGRRFWQRTSPSMARTLTAVLLLSPQTPLLFQGQEFAATTPFHYFLGINGNLAKRVRAGRIEFLRQFQNMRDEAILGSVAPPHERATFERSKLDWREHDTHGEVVALHRDLIALRRTEKAIARQSGADRGALDGGVMGADAFFLRYFAEEPADHRLLLVNLGHDLPVRSIANPLAAPPEGLEWRQNWSSEDPKYGGEGRREIDPALRFTLPGQSAVLFGLQPARTPAPFDKERERQWQYGIF